MSAGLPAVNPPFFASKEAIFASKKSHANNANN
jgi:hypothetical protein